MATEELGELATRILRDLKLASLRARYKALGPLAKLESFSGQFYFYSDPYEFAASSEEVRALQQRIRSLNQLPSIVMRQVELAADGIRPRVVGGSEAGQSELSIFVDFNERGRSVLERSGASRSTIIRSARDTLRSSYWLFAIALVGIVLVERLHRHGWAITFLGLGLLFAISALSVWFVRKRS